MTILQHAVHGFIIGKMLRRSRARDWIPEWLPAALALVGAWPDIIGFAEKLVRWDWHAWTWYNAMHEFAWWQIILAPWALHVLVDWLWHDPAGGWRWWGIWAEIAAWMAIVVWMLWRIRARGWTSV